MGKMVNLGVIANGDGWIIETISQEADPGRGAKALPLFSCLYYNEVMKQDFWQKLNKPFYALAPLAGVSDLAFRQICKDWGADVVYSEMASATALFYAPEKTLELVRFEAKERPYVVQLFGSVPEHFSVACKIIEEQIKPDGIDINFGCPVPKVAKQNAGAELFKDMGRSHAVIEACVDSTSLPVSIKTRTEAGATKLLPFLDKISDLGVAAIMIHGRSLRQGFSGPIDCELIREARSHFGGIIMANGGINDHIEAARVLRESGADGLGIGRGAFGKPWIFKELKDAKAISLEPSEKIAEMLKHAELFAQKNKPAAFAEMRKHFAWYAQGFAGAKELRECLIMVSSLEELKSKLNNQDTRYKE